MKRLVLLLVSVLLIDGSPAQAQQRIPGEIDTEHFIATFFDIQQAYTGVRCVAENPGNCPSQVEAEPPCYLQACVRSRRAYPISATYDTIQAAVDDAQPGELILVYPGRYAGVEVENRGGEDGAYIHIKGMSDAGPVIVDRSADPSKSYLRHHFYFINTHHFIIEGLTFTDANEGAGLFFSGYFSETGSFSHHMIVSNVYSHDNYRWGMHSTATSYLLIQDSVFTNAADEHGLYISGAGDDVFVRRNVFQGNNAGGVQVNADPQTSILELFYWLQNSSGDTCGFSEADAEFYGSATLPDLIACYDSQDLPDLGAFFEDGVSERLFIENNIITGNGSAGGAGINLASVRHSLVRGNLIYGNAAAGIACWDNGYAEENGLDSSEYGCHDVRILNNTLVDETGNRGALILNNDARDMQVYNNIIVRDRFDAYEVSSRAGTRMRSANNAFTAQYIEDSPGFAGDQNAIADLSVPDALAGFAAPGFAPWVLHEGDGYVLNPARPDLRPRPDSIYVDRANRRKMPLFDRFGQTRMGEIGALAAITPEALAALDAMPDAMPDAAPGISTLTPPSTAGTVVYAAGESLYMIADGVQTDLSAALEGLSPGGQDIRVNLSADGQWLVIETTRFDPECAGWACLVLIDRDLNTPEVLYADGAAVHPEGYAAVTSGGDFIVYTSRNGPNINDVYAITRQDDGTWSTPLALSADSPYAWNAQPALSADGQRVLFDCGPNAYGQDGTAICEVKADGSELRVVLDPAQPIGDLPTPNALHHPAYAPDGSIVFEGDFYGEQIWVLSVGDTLPTRFSDAFNNDNAPCVLPNGTIASLWLGREAGDGLHEIKLMTPDGGHTMLLTDVDVWDIGLGCGQ